MSAIGEILNNGLRKIFGSKYERDIKAIQPLVEEINKHYAGLSTLSDEELKGKTEEFRNRLQEGETTDDIMTEAFAVVKETCRRLMGQKWMVLGHETLWDMIPYDCQLIGAIVLHQGKIAEMATGEGKSLVATMPLYLNSLTGKGAHFVTVNDYLVQRDVEWYGKIYEFLGVTVGYVVGNSPTEVHKAAYEWDITYGTNNEFGFDYLRDNMAIREEDVVQNGFNYALVDEVDSVLIDEARTPLIISGPVSVSTHKYEEMKPLVYDIVKKQTALVSSKIAEAEKLLKDGNEYEACTLLLQALRGTPKNKRLMKLFADRPELKKQTHTVENDYMRDKRMNEIDEKLLFVVDERHHTIAFTDKAINGMNPDDRKTFVLPDINEEISKIEHDESLSDEEKILKQEEITSEFALKSEKIHNTNQLLRAYVLFEKDKEYVVQDGKVLIVDEFTGRLMQGRRFSDGLHQALEAKERVKIERETQTFATITLQNYFRMYNKLSGMTGTAETEASEFWDIYKLDVIVIPTNRPVIRTDFNDQIYRTRREKFNAIIERIRSFHNAGRPVLVGTVNVDVSETLSRMLKRQSINHNVLNAKQHLREAEIISHAGTEGAVTIATNMAGRGTDIKLESVVRKMGGDGDHLPGGLQIIGTERHEARRIDRQLRGRSGRQGDHGSSMFFLSLEDDLMRLFGSDRISGIMQSLGIEEGEVITHSMVTKAIDRAQKRVEAQNFAIRKHLLEYDNVMNSQREIIYGLRNTALKSGNVRERLFEMVEDVIDNLIEQYTELSGMPDDWDMDALSAEFLTIFYCHFTLTEEQNASFSPEALKDYLVNFVKESYLAKAEIIEPESLKWNERVILLSTIDGLWKEHLYEMDQLKEGIGLRGYGQRDPLIEYKREGFILFESTLDQINTSTLKTLFRGVMSVQFKKAERKRIPEGKTQTQHEELGVYSADNVQESSQALPPAKPQTVIRDGKKIGRNEPCPCGSGKKYKHCCGIK
ncbi:preprotein translocase subunit SecA [Candidatus Latescibacterota bacterium]